jgi:choline transport protein
MALVIWVSMHFRSPLRSSNPPTIAEEVVNASTIVPWCMISTILLNGALGFAIVLAFLFCIGDMSVLESPTGYDFIEVFFNATKSHAGTSVMTAIPIVLVICASFGFLASASRLTWAFARDKGLPFADFLAHVTISLFFFSRLLFYA